MTEKCMYCEEPVPEKEFGGSKAVKVGWGKYAHAYCLDNHGKENTMTEKCMYCGKEVTQLQYLMGKGTKTIHDLYAHTGCINSHKEKNTMTEQTQHILGAADSAHQGLGLAVSLLQESLANMGEILTQGCEVLGEASLGSTMRLGQCIKEAYFLLGGIHLDAWGLCILLGKDLEVCEDETDVVSAGPPRPSDRPEYTEEMFGDEHPGPDRESEEYDDDDFPL